MERKSFNEVLKQRELRERAERAKDTGPIKLDDSQRVKVLSPGRMVFKRFIRNRLAIVGSAILIFMFLFSFAFPLFYPYGQTDRFYKYEPQMGDYAGAQRRTEYTNYAVEGKEVTSEVSRRVNSAILSLKSREELSYVAFHVDSGSFAVVRNADDANIYSVWSCTEQETASYHTAKRIGGVDKVKKAVDYASGVTELPEEFVAAALEALSSRTNAFSYDGKNYELRNTNKVSGDVYEISDMSFAYTGAALSADFETAVLTAVEKKNDVVEFDGSAYLITEDDGLYTVSAIVPQEIIMVSTTYVFNTVTLDTKLSDAFKSAAILSRITGEPFTVDGETYTLVDEDGALEIKTAAGAEFAMLSDFVVRGVDGKDSFDIEFKEAVEEAVEAMEARGDKSTTMTYPLLKRVTEFKTDEDGNQVKDEKGDPIEIVVVQKDEDGNDVYEDTEITIKKQVNDYVLSCPIMRRLFDINGMPSSSHLFGTDSDGYDVLSRMMYGGRISLMVGFIVVIIETILGTILGGIAGYFGGWVDNLIMRLVDIFYCIPTMPILIIMGSFMDYLRLTPYERLAWMMVILGVLGWSYIARLVRGQILSLREQEFMVATEATGVRVRRRIFRHLVPNVMPQLIVSATAGLGNVILTESTLSFLGLGVKHPMATWGTMINSITQRNEDMIKYTYIWIPVGLLICLTVIAFNFVGDGLRDAFDPKMKK